MHLVARSGNVDAAKLLLKAGAKVNTRERFGEQTPLMWAAARRHPQMVELLLSKGADVNARGAVRDYRRVATAESRAAPRDRGGFTPLMYAARGNCGECVEALLKHKADVNLADPSFVVPLSIAMMNGNWDIAKRLRRGRCRREPVGHERQLAAACGHRQPEQRWQPQPARSGQAQQGFRA